MTRVPSAALELRGATKSFAGVTVLEDVDLTVQRGQIHGLLGGNGSGKSTLIKIMAGVYQSDAAGTLTTALGSVGLASMTPPESRRLGLRFVHQNLGLLPGLSIAENMALGTAYPRRGPQIRWRALRDWTAERLAEFGIAADPGDPVSTLRPAEQTLVAVARALADRNEVPEAVLVLDEPTATLPKHEVDMLFDALRLSSAAGQTIVIVSHRIDEVLALTDSVTVLRDGREVVTTPTPGLTESELVTHIVGRAVGATRTARRPVGETFAHVQGLDAGLAQDIDFDIRAGEIIGLAGILGSGRSEVLRALFGDLRGSSGSVAIAGGPEFLARKPSDAMKRGIAYVPEDRAEAAALPSLAVFENITVADLPAYARGPQVSSSRLRKRARDLMREFLVRAPDERIELQYLSGGNQQKVLLARWLSRKPQLLLLDEPTQGVDVGAREEIYHLIRQAVDEGTAVLLVSSDYEELARFCDRVLVLRDGRIATVLDGDHLDAHTITTHVHTGAAA